jgi:hypothetical protein
LANEPAAHVQTSESPEPAVEKPSAHVQVEGCETPAPSAE